MRLRLFAAAGAAVLVFVLVLVPASFAAQRVDGITSKPDWFDSRAATVASPTAAQRDAVAALLSRAGAGTRVTWDHRFGTPRTILNTKGYLSGPSAGAAVDVARAWVNDNRAALGLSAGDVQALAVTRDHALPGTGTHVIDFQQVVAGVQTVAGGRLIVAVTGNGRVLSYAGDVARSPGRPGRRVRAQPAQALAKVAASLAPGVAFTPSPSGTQAGYDVFARGPFAAVQRVGKAAFLQAGAARPAYRVLFVPKLDEGYDVVVDAGTGAVLSRRSLVAHESEGSVYENFPGAPQGGTQVTKSFGPTPESPGGYTDPTGMAGSAARPPSATTPTPTRTTRTSSRRPTRPAPGQPDEPVRLPVRHELAAHERSDGAAVLRAGSQPRRHEPLLDSTTASTTSTTATASPSRPATSSSTTSTGRQRRRCGAAWCTPGAASGGAPTYTGRDNAYFLTPPDGLPAWSGMFLWEPIHARSSPRSRTATSTRRSIQHEYTHGMTTRMVGGGEALGGEQAGAMGEGWSDWYALNHLFDAGLETQPIDGEYVTGNPDRGIRN